MSTVLKASKRLAIASEDSAMKNAATVLRAALTKVDVGSSPQVSAIQASDTGYDFTVKNMVALDLAAIQSIAVVMKKAQSSSEDPVFVTLEADGSRLHVSVMAADLDAM